MAILGTLMVWPLSRSTATHGAKESVKAALKGCAVLYRMAALYDCWRRDKKECHDINVEGTRMALDGSAGARSRKGCLREQRCGAGLLRKRMPSQRGRGVQPLEDGSALLNLEVDVARGHILAA